MKNAQEATNRLLHPSALEVTKGVEIRKLELVDFPAGERNKGIGVLLRVPMMHGIRVLRIADRISVSQLFVIFRNLPRLVVLSVSVNYGRIECDDFDVHEGYEGGESSGRLWGDATWKSGFGNLKRLTIHLNGGRSAGLDLVDVMSAYLGPQLESLRITQYDDPPTAVDHFFRKVAGNCPNLKAFDMPDCRWLLHLPGFIESASRLTYLALNSGSEDLIRTAAATCVHLKYLILARCKVTRETLRHLANGPFLRGFDNSWLGYLERTPDSLNEDDYESFLKERGSCLEILKLGIPDASDRTLERILAFCPELRELNARKFGNLTEEGVIEFLNRSPKLKRISLPRHRFQNRMEAILGAARAKNIKEELINFPKYGEMLEEHLMGW
ncbi:hypothetical protein HK104_009245 [Borealophlyctis nickersoniae]|nr:hypothetical protein HK104_009245 [Borealophlyctis nickersoniae]